MRNHRVRSTPVPLLTLAVFVCCGGLAANPEGAASPATTAGPKLEPIRLDRDGAHFVGETSGARFVAWGFNYDHDAGGRLLEDYWSQEWPTVVGDFKEMKQLGANVARIHLQVARFMKSPRETNAEALVQLARLVRLAEDTGLYLDVTGLGCYHRKDVPPWYDRLSEAGRWNVQAAFWEAVARVCASSPAVFCYDLMNEPILPGSGRKETEWLAGEFAGSCFVQRLTLDLGDRTQEEVARQWVEKLVAAIRQHDRRHLITVGVIPWAHVFPGAKPLFYSKTVGRHLDFASVHFYPKKGKVAEALTALKVYQVGKPLVVEEMFPLECGIEELGAFIEGSRKLADGWMGFYWGKTIEEYSAQPPDLVGTLTRSWLEYFRRQAPVMLGPQPAGAGPRGPASAAPPGH